MTTNKLYCYVDESGQDTLGRFFIVSVVVTEKDKETLETKLIEIEKMSLKGRRKWSDTREQQKISYISSLLREELLLRTLYYAFYENTVNYLPNTVLATARAILFKAEESYQAIVFVDGLQKSQTKWFGTELRHLRIKTEKVRGVKKEESSAIMRLADALSGFIRESVEGKEEFVKILERAKKKGFVKEI